MPDFDTDDVFNIPDDTDSHLAAMTLDGDDDRWFVAMDANSNGPDMTLDMLAAIALSVCDNLADVYGTTSEVMLTDYMSMMERRLAGHTAPDTLESLED